MEDDEMQGISWRWVVALGVMVAGAVTAAALGEVDLAGILGGAAAGLLGPARRSGNGGGNRPRPEGLPGTLAGGIVLACVLVHSGGCAAPDDSPRDRAHRALAVAEVVVVEAEETFVYAVEHDLCEGRADACEWVLDAIVAAREAVYAASAQLRGWTEGEPLPCVADSLSHLARALSALGLSPPGELGRALELMSQLGGQCDSSNRLENFSSNRLENFSSNRLENFSSDQLELMSGLGGQCDG